MFKTIVAPVDLERPSSAGVRYAASLAREYGGRVILVHVMSSQSVDIPPFLHSEEHIADDQRAKARAVLDQLVASELEGVDVGIELVFGDPLTEILEVTKEVGADAVVITVKNRSRVGKLLMGSQAQNIILASSVPVICVHRD